MDEPAAAVRGVLHPDAAAGRLTLAQVPPSDDLAPFVEYYWIVRWDLRGQPPHEQSVLSHPSVHLAFEPDGALVYGVPGSVFTRCLTGAGKVLGVRFRPGCFRPFAPGPASSLFDRVVPAATCFGSPVDEASQAIMAAGPDEDMVAIAAGLLRSARPARDPVAEQVAAMVERITTDRQLRKVGELAGAFCIPERKLQRLFSEYVGVSPKWVMRRARLQEAALRADSGQRVDWAALARDLGYADQSHLTRDFTATIGVPPARYALRAPVDAARPPRPRG